MNVVKNEGSLEDAVIKLLELEYLLDAAFHACEIGDLPQCETGLLLAQEKLKVIKSLLSVSTKL